MTRRIKNQKTFNVVRRQATEMTTKRNGCWRYPKEI